MTKSKKKNDRLNMPLAEFLISEVYRMSIADYQEIVNTFQKNHSYFAEPGDSELKNKTSGKIFRERFNEGNEIYSISTPQRKNLSNIKNKFLIKYLDLLGVPDVSDEPLPNAESRFNEPGIFTKDRVFYSDKAIKFLAASAKEYVDSGSRLIWINEKDIYQNKTFVKTLTEKIRFVTGLTDLVMKSSKEIIQFLNKGKFTIVADVTALKTPLQDDIRLVNLLKDLSLVSDNFRLFIITEEPELFNHDLIQEEDTLLGMEQEEENHVKQDRGYRVLKIAVILLIMILPGTIYLYSISGDQKAVVKMFHYGDLPVKDSFRAGVQFIWLDEMQQQINSSPGTYFASHELFYKPEHVRYLLPAAEGYKSVPEIIPVEMLGNNDLRISFYRKLNLNDQFSDQIVRPSAQRWFVFSLSKPSRVLFRVKAISEKFSPQTAIFGDPAGLKRITRSSNFDGKAMSDSTFGFLEAGEYYLKVRGYDSLTGKFMVEGLISD